jgi:hypothetical protein
MELDNIIYIIITFAILIVSLLGQSKKKKPAQPISNDDEVYSLNDFEKILERKQEYRVEEELNIKTEVTEQPFEVKKEPIIQEKNHPTKQKLKKEENEVDDGFDIKSAIIYSSILERKKFRH